RLRTGWRRTAHAGATPGTAGPALDLHGLRLWPGPEHRLPADSEVTRRTRSGGQGAYQPASYWPFRVGSRKTFRGNETRCRPTTTPAPPGASHARSPPSWLVSRLSRPDKPAWRRAALSARDTSGLGSTWT